MLEYVTPFMIIVKQVFIVFWRTYFDVNMMGNFDRDRYGTIGYVKKAEAEV